MLAFAELAAGPIAALPPAAARIAWRKAVYYFGTHSFTTRETDSPASRRVRGGLRPFRWRAELGVDRLGRFAGARALTVGQLELENASRDLDGLLDVGWCDGREVRIKVGRRITDAEGRRVVVPYAEFGDLLRAPARQWVVSDTSALIRLRDGFDRLRQPISPSIYSGGGGAGGGAELAGLGKPLGYGFLRNVAWVQVDATRNIFQGHDGKIQSVLGVRDGGIALTWNGVDYTSYAALEAATVDAGKYATCLAGGYLRCGAAPLGQLTVDFEGAAAGRTKGFFSDGSRFSDGAGFASQAAQIYVKTTAGIISRILTDQARVSPRQIESTSFSRVEANQPAEIGYAIAAGDTRTVLDVVDEIAAAAGCTLSDDTFGRLQLDRFEAPPDSSARELTDRTMLAVRRQALPWPDGSMPYAWQVAYDRNWTLQRGTLLQGASAATKGFAERAVSYVAAQTSRVRSVLPSSTVATVEGFFRHRDDAAAEAQRLALLYTLERQLYEVPLPLFGSSLRRGQTLSLRYPAPGLEGGKVGRVIGVEINSGTRSSTLTVFA